MKKPLLSLILLLLAFNTYSQIYLNPGVDTTLTEVKTALRFYTNYLDGFNGKQIPDLSSYWSAAELKQRKIPDQLIYAINDNPLYAQGYRPTILYIRSKSKYVHIKTQFSYADSSGNIMTMAVTNHYIGTDDHKKPYFINPMTENLADWRIKTVRNVDFYYPSNHKFNHRRADSLIKNIVKLEKEWNLKPIHIKYYLSDDNDELYKLRGFDYTVMMGNKLKPSGISDDRDNQVFCGGYGENYFHEVVHVYLNRLHIGSPIREGLAVLYGGSMGHPIKWHLKRVNQYLREHQEADLSKIEDFWYTDPYTNPGSAIQGMICKLVYEKDGINGLKRLMTYKSYQELFEKEFNVSTEQLNAFLRQKINEEAT
ncbi:hypothetical protein [Pedobacter foliorum]|uniref:hypothetical protein n=1 Tax=Pedobacter foliorum TaxID=2739058 RepID=UPI001567B6FD|nr:hypothetical protein [Pedobacter foliorum]NRF40696.1 hypothetical protein [Pedobacter foliorum]